MSEPTLTEFLLAQIAKDENGRARALRDMAEALRNQGMGLAADWLMEESARVLAECEAKRRIVELHHHVPADYKDGDPDAFGCIVCHEDRDYGIIADSWCETLRLLALPYVDHPDYRAEWRP